MKKLFCCTILFPFLTLGQSLFSNSITATNPNELNPYNIEEVVDPNITVSGIGRGNGISGVNAYNRYDARSWNSFDLDPSAYFEFTITPNANKKIDFVSFEYSGQVSLLVGPVNFAFRSSIDGFATDIGTVTATGSTVSLSGAAFQNITTAITFRFYAWGALAGTGTFSINDFTFNGIIDCAIPATPQLIDIATICTSTSFTINWDACFNATEYNLDVATDDGFINFVPEYTNRALGNVTTQNVTGLVAGKKYYIRLHAKNDCGHSAYSNTATASPISTTYNGITWSNGPPDQTKQIIFSSNYTISDTIEACSCTVETGISVGINSGVVLKLQNGLDVIDTATITFENNASLIQVNDDAVNTGAIIYKRNSTPMKNFDYTYWSSPVENQVLNMLSPNTLRDKYFSFANNNWVVELDGTNVMHPPGKGYIIRVPKPNFWPNPLAPNYIQSVQFIGVPNNGTKSLAIAPNGYANLIGNPYPSAISADAFLTANNKEIDGTLYFWTHNTVVTNLKYSSTDYASYNFTGGVGTYVGIGNFVDTNNNGTIDHGEEQILNKPSGNIAAGQSFFVLTKATSGYTGSVVFNNSMRVGASNGNAQFFKGIKSKKADIEKHRIWLNLTNTEGAFKQMLIGYATGATNGFDTAFDGESYDGNKYIDFYSLNDNKNFVIQGRALPFDKTDKIPLGYKTSIEGIFAISIDQVDGALESQTVFVEDKATGVIHNLKTGAYSFSTLKGVFNDRFVLRYTDNSVVVVDPFVTVPVVVDPVVTNPVVVDPVVLEPVLEGGATLGTDSFDAKGRLVLVYVKDHHVKITSFDETIGTVMVYDLRGRLLYENGNVNNKEFVIQNVALANQVLIVKTQLKNEKWAVNQIFF